MLMRTSEGTTIVTQQEKVKRNPTTDEQFISKALLCSILSVVEKASLKFAGAVFIFATDNPSRAKPTFTRYIF